MDAKTKKTKWKIHRKTFGKRNGDAIKNLR